LIIGVVVVIRVKPHYGQIWAVARLRRSRAFPALAAAAVVINAIAAAAAVAAAAAAAVAAAAASARASPAAVGFGACKVLERDPEVPGTVARSSASAGAAVPSGLRAARRVRRGFRGVSCAGVAALAGTSPPLLPLPRTFVSIALCALAFFLFCRFFVGRRHRILLCLQGGALSETNSAQGDA
jgi:hypothetical protein